MDLPVERCDRIGDIHTGGYPDILGNRVKRYNYSGLEETLPDFRQERRGHGCGSYVKDGKKVFQTFMMILLISVDLKKYLVAGGFSFGTLFSTEIWSPGDSSWITVSQLPRTVAYTESVSLNNRIYLFGKNI